MSSGQVCSALAGDSILTPGWDPSFAPGVKGSLKSSNLVLRLWKTPLYNLILCMSCLTFLMGLRGIPCSLPVSPAAPDPDAWMICLSPLGFHEG